MKNTLILFLTITTILGCKGQVQPKKDFYSKEFRWSITIPENFENVRPEEWEKMQNRGKAAIEKTYDQKIENNAKTIFALRSDQFNYFESNYQPFDTAKDGNFSESFNEVNGVLYNTFKDNMPGAKLDSSSSQEIISGLTFDVFKIKIDIKNKLTLNLWMYSRLFGKREFTVNIMTADKEKQKILVDAWTNSKFLISRD